MTETLDANGYKLIVSREHRFGTDAVKLAEFTARGGSALRKAQVICDLCTGCGIVPFLLINKRENSGSPCKLYAVDIDPRAIDLLRESVTLNALDGVIVPICADLKNLKDEKTIAAGSADIVTVNPPYFKADNGKKREDGGTARHELLCTISDVAAAAARLLKYGGRLKMCHIPERLADVVCALREHNLEPKTIEFVLNNNGGGVSNGKPWLMLIDAKKGGRAGAEVVVRK